MEKIKDVLKNNNQEEIETNDGFIDFLNWNVKVSNEKVGDLKNYDCPICKNKGYVSYINEEESEVFTKSCSCMKIRKIKISLEKSNLPKTFFEEYTLDKFTTEKDWQEKVKQKIKNYIKKLNENQKFNDWLVLSSPSGYGKTHLCTAVFHECINSGRDCKYMLWKDDLHMIKSLKKSSHIENIEKYEELMKSYKTIEVLYIDDFLKLLDNYSLKEDLDIAYEIVNSRYNNSLTTIISTEYNGDSLSKLDVAISGRIAEKTKMKQKFRNKDDENFWIEIKARNDGNFRLN